MDPELVNSHSELSEFLRLLDKAHTFRYARHYKDISGLFMSSPDLERLINPFSLNCRKVFCTVKS